MDNKFYPERSEGPYPEHVEGLHPELVEGSHPERLEGPPKPRRSSKPRRLPGGQPGNVNALKHGFYSSRFNKRELEDLDNTSPSGLQDEIALLRTFARRLVECYTPGCDLYDTAYIVRVLCFSSTCINRMLKTQRVLSAQSFKEEFDQSLKEALEIVNAEWDLEIEKASLPASSGKDT